MEFSTKKTISPEPIPNRIVTYITSKDGRLLEIKVVGETEIGINLKTQWYIPEEVPILLECYNMIKNEIEQYEGINYRTAIGSKGNIASKKREREIPFKILKNVMNPLIITKQEDIAIGINSNYGSFWLQGEKIKEGAEKIEIVSPFNLSKLVSQLALETRLIENYQRQDMETILDLTYDYYINEDRPKLQVIR